MDNEANRFILLLFPLLILPLLIPTFLWRVHPTRQMVFLFLVPLAVSAGFFLSDVVVLIVLAMDGVFILLLLADIFTLPLFRQVFAAERTTPRIASLTKPHPVTLAIRNLSKFPYKILVRDDIPPGFVREIDAETDVFRQHVLPARSLEKLDYEMQPNQRGLFLMDMVAIRVKSLFGFWIRDFQISCKSELCVYPNLRQISQYEILARTDRLYQLGVRAVRRVGHDNDFERLRDYQLDDQFKFIDWSATAKRNKLMVKGFQTSRSQRIMFMVDCGRMMTNESEGLNLLDHSLNAMLMLGYVAIRQADDVGMLCFSDRILNYVPPGTGQRQMSRILHGCFDLFAEQVESRYDDAFSYLATRCRKRALVILITNVADEVNANQVSKHLKNLGGKHLPFGVFLRDHQIFDAVTDADDPKFRDFWRSGAAAQILNWRHKVITDLKHQGTLTLDVFPEEMTTPLINRYLEIKARQLL